MTPHFSKSELFCKCGCGMLPAQDFMDKVEKLRVAVGFPLRVTSAARCPDHNSRVSGTGRSGPHTTGRAIDLGVTHGQAYTVLAKALEMRFTGIGVNQKGGARFIHLDDLTAGRPTVWSY
jgi:zinc D-Ala-D-Ala carboxypeptidase